MYSAQLSSMLGAVVCVVMSLSVKWLFVSGNFHGVMFVISSSVYCLLVRDRSNRTANGI